MQLPDTTNAWLAALVDGEGSIMLNKRTFSGNSDRTTKRGRNHQYRAVIAVANTDYRLMEALRERVGCGQVYEHVVSNTSGSFNPRKRRQWTWRLNATQIPQYLPALLPWLVLKREQAELLLEALDLKRQLTPVAGSGWHLDRDVKLTRLDEIYLAIREANTRGHVA